MAIGSITVLALIIALAAPRAAHGIVATFVQVVNTSAQPVPILATDALSSFNVTGSCSTSGSSFCQIFPLYTVPGGKIAVIESTSGRCLYNAGNLYEARLEFWNAIGGIQGFFLERTHGSSGVGTVDTWTHSVKIYAFNGSSGNAIKC